LLYVAQLVAKQGLHIWDFWLRLSYFWKVLSAFVLSHLLLIKLCHPLLDREAWTWLSSSHQWWTRRVSECVPPPLACLGWASAGMVRALQGLRAVIHWCGACKCMPELLFFTYLMKIKCSHVKLYKDSCLFLFHVQASMLKLAPCQVYLISPW
jgi:hypothetical protein